MTIKRRLLIFGTGLLIGTLLSYVLLGWKGCGDWLPERRLRADIEMAGWDEDERASCLRACWGDSVPSAVDWLYSAEIDWQASGPRETPQRYVLKPTEGPASELTFTRQGTVGRWVLSVTGGDIEGCVCP